MGLVVSFFGNITNPLAVLNCLMIGFIGTILGGVSALSSLFGKKKKSGGIPDWLGKILGEVGGGLFEGLAGGAASKQEREQKFKTYERLRESRRPDKPYSRGVDPVVQRAIENIFTSRGLANPYATTATGGTGQISQGGGRFGGARQGRRDRKEARGERL
jgi:amino acid transporter